MKINVSSESHIVRFIVRMREFRDLNTPFPEDICTMTREFIASLVLFSFLTFLVGSVLISMPSILLIPFYGLPQGDFNLLFVLGAIGWSLIFTSMVLLFCVLVKERHYPYFIDEKINTWKESSLLVHMWRSLKDKTCVRVEIKNETR